MLFASAVVSLHPWRAAVLWPTDLLFGFSIGPAVAASLPHAHRP